MKRLFNLKRSKQLLLMLFAMMAGGVSSAWAETLTETFDDVTVTSRYLLSNGWVMVHNNGNYQGFGGSYDYQIKSGNYDGNTGSSLFCSYSDNNEYVVIPTKLTGTFTYYAKRAESSNGTVTFFEATKDGDDFVVTTTQLATTSTSSSWGDQKSFVLGDGGKYVAISLLKSRIDQISATIYEEANGPALVVMDGETKLVSPYSYNFGLATANTTKTFTLSNPGTADLDVSVSETGNFGATLSASTIAAGGEVTLTLTMPSTSGSSAVTITPDAEGLDPFVINVSGTIKDPNKVFLDFADGTIPNGWTSVAIGSYGSEWQATEGYVYQSGSSSSYEWAFTSPVLSFDKDEVVLFETQKYSSSTWYNPSIKVQYTTDGTNWVTIGSAFTDDAYDSWTLRSVVIPVEGVKGIRFSGWYVKLRNIYGGEEVAGANFAINTNGSNQDFGRVNVNEVAEKTYTITNSGNADLTVSFTDAADFYVPMIVKFTKPNGWSGDKLFVYAWNNSGALVGAWPGIEVTEAAQNDMNEWVYTAKLPKSATGIKFSDNQGNETGDISTSEFKHIVGLWHDGSTVQTWQNIDFTVAAGSSANFTVKMDTKTIGTKSGNINLAFEALNATSFTIPCTGTVLDPNYLIVDFEDNAFPEGWQKGADWAIGSASGNHYAVQSNTTTASALVTTPLIVAENETLTFKVARNAQGSGYTKSLKVRYSIDGGVNWSEYVTYNSDNFGSGFASYSLTGVPAGTVIVEFFGNNIKLDDIEGFVKTTAPALALTENGTAVANNDTKDFGNLTAAGELTYTLKNIGNETLVTTVKGEGVTINNSNSDVQIQLPAGDQIDLTVRMAYGEPYGERTGMKMTIDSEDEWISDFVVNFTANLVDPSDFVIDFENGKPAGWYFDTWNVANGVAYINSGNAKPMITELIGAEIGKNVLTFDAKMYYNYETGNPTLSVYTSADRKNWTLAKTCTLQATSQTYTQTLADGEYYVKFESNNASVDNIKGVKKLEAPAHDLYLVEATLPTDEISPVDTYTATLKVASLRADEDVTAELYFGETKVGETTMTIANGATQTITVTGTAPAAGTFEVYAKVYNDNVTVETEKVNVIVADRTELKITDFAVVSNNVEADANNKFTAEFTVTVQNTGSTTLTAEQVSVTITDLDGNVYETATATDALAAGVTATINVSVTAPAGDGGEFNFNVKENVSEAYWYPNLGDYKTVNVTAAPVIVLNENGDGTFATGENRKVRLNHTFAAGWNTICLPFATTPSEIASGAKALAFTAYNADTNELTFSPATELEANKPYAIYVENAITEPIEFTGMTVVASEELGVTFNGVTFQGTYAPTGEMNQTWYGLTAAGRIAKASATATLKGFRAYFIGLPATGATVRFLDNVSTGISTISVDNNVEGVYNLQGQKVEQLRKGGLYIINGKKTMVK